MFYSDSGSVNTLTLGMIGWAAVMTLAVGIIIAAVIIRQKRSNSSPDVETPSAISNLPKDPHCATQDNIAQIHSQPKNLYKSTDQSN